MKALTLKSLKAQGGIKALKLRKERCITADKPFSFVAAVRVTLGDGTELDVLANGDTAFVDPRGLHGFHVLRLSSRAAYRIWEDSGAFDA